MEATLDRFGRIVIPKEVRDDLGLSPGSVLNLEESGHRITLTPVREKEHLAQKNGILVYTGEFVGDLEGVLSRDRDERARKLLGIE